MLILRGKILFYRPTRPRDFVVTERSVNGYCKKIKTPGEESVAFSTLSFVHCQKFQTELFRRREATFPRTMGTMRNNFATVFVLLLLMLSTSQSLPHGYENSSKRNSLADDLTSDDRTALYPIYNCLFVDPDLPICDVELMLNSDEKTTERTNDQYFDKDLVTRSRRNADVSATARVVVYAIEGCVPARLPFSLPSCNGISLNNIVDVRRLRPFVVKGMTQPPYVFPKFNYSKWIRMMARLHSRVSSKKQDIFNVSFQEEESSIPKEISAENSLEDRREELRIMPKGSAPTHGTRKSEVDESRESSASSSVENINNDSQITLTTKSENFSSKKNIKKIEKMNKRRGDAWKGSKDQNEGVVRSFQRRRREIRLSGNGLMQGIPDESKAQGIAGKSIAQRFQSNGETDQLNISNEQRKHSISTTEIPGLDTENRGTKSRFDDPSFKIDMASRKSSWRRGMMKDAALGKKHKIYSELSASASQ
ncbi:uncharacterized protein LOC117606571 isoform X1 [Osmia lignaria lignaria]|uniref:uncharacterized protein LOC117606571 isoform X1 n=2 Tax=Osmia lignaria lignaria TaxID=1437193 RepID=UPI00402B6D42